MQLCKVCQWAKEFQRFASDTIKVMIKLLLELKPLLVLINVGHVNGLGLVMINTIIFIFTQMCKIM